MKLKVTIAEADIARVEKAQAAQFTVDAWPDRTYAARVVKVAYGSTVTNNVVTYVTELEVANDDLSLRPGMTATAEIRVAESHNVLLVPTAASRFDPAAMSAAAPTMPKKSFVQSIMPMPPRMSRRPDGSGDENTKLVSTKIWVLRDGAPQPLTVKVGLSDGRRTEVSGEGLSEGLPVILRVNTAQP
jgi:HlyD family secretion protein